MPATSQQQQKLFGLALSVKRGETPRSEASEDVLGIVDSMTEKEIEDFAGTSHKGLPKKVEEMIRGMVRENLKQTLSEANPRLNKKVKSYLDSYLSGVKKNSPEHQHALMLIMRGALTDANFHSEARQLSKYFPKASQHKTSPQMEDVIESKGEDIASWAKWDGHDIIDAFGFYTSMSIGGSFGAKFQSLKEGLAESWIPKMYKTFRAVKGKLEKLEIEQKKMLAQWKAEKDPKKKKDILDKMKVGTKQIQKVRANLDTIENDYINKMSYDTSYSESVNEAASRTAMEIGGYTGLNKNAVQKFVDDNNLDIEKVFQYVKKGKLKDRMNLVSAIAGKPSNPVQKKIIKMFGESINERLSNQDIKRMDGLHSYKKMDEALKLLIFIGRELIDEGWEKEEVTEYIQKKVLRRLYLQL